MEVVEENIIEPSEDENDLNLINTSRVKKRAKILDSDDSGNEETTDKINDNAVDSEKEDTISNLTPEPVKRTKLKRITRIHSDSDDDEALTTKTSNLEDTQDPSRAPNVSVTDPEDVADEEEVAPHNKSFPDEQSAVEAVIYTTNNKGELIPENVLQGNPSLSALCDSESEEEERDYDNVVDPTMDEMVQPKIYKRSRRKNPEDESQKMTAQEAAKQRMEIHSESQRMLRESNVSLPYHKPKTYTIREFLQKRSKLASALPPIPKAPPSIAIKMSKDQLKEVSKKLDERIKEVEKFYKSESEDDEEEEDNASEEIRSWLDAMVDQAMDGVEEKLKEMEEANKAKEIQETSKESIEMDFNLDEMEEEESQKKPNISEIIKDKLHIQPRLSGATDDVIDLEEGVTRVSRVKQLVDKFFQHTAKKASHKHKVQLDVLEVCSGGQIVKETVSMNVDEEEEPTLVETPGAKLHKLREELQQQMAQKRLELWKQKHEQGDCLTVEKGAKEGYEEGAEDILDDEEEEFEMTESESEEEEEEEDVIEEPKVRSDFVDEEADEDDEMEEDGDEEDGGDGFEADVEEPAEEEAQSPKKRALKRIVKPFSMDSDDEDEDVQSQKHATVVKYFPSDEDDVLPPNLPRVGITPQRTQSDKSKSEFDFLTPVTYLTGLQTLNSDSKFLQDSPKSPFAVPFGVPDSQEQCSQPQSQIQKNLFPDASQKSQESMEDVARLCSGTFSQTQNREIDEKSLEQEPEEELPSTQDLLNMCSGDFSSQMPATCVNQEEEPKKIVVHEVIKIPAVQSSQKEIKSLDEEQDQIISQLLDEDELERFKKKFESPVNPTIRKAQALENMADMEEVNATGLINSDDENEELEVKQKKRKKLMFSDEEEDEDDVNDEEEEEDGGDDEEEIDLHDDVDDEEQQLENELVEKESHKFKLADFLDKEAELSESEWGSADEDEKGLDVLEFEEGDKETFNEKKMRTEIERIHMRQLLDDDNREVKLLQELLLEDGELHGTGRKRQFKWKALDSEDNGEFERRDDDDIFLDEEESEEQWRKMRHKREMFLKKKKTNEEEGESVLGDSQILKMGQQILKNTSFSSQNSTPVGKPADDVSPLGLLNKRGSFLSRKDEVLQRLAEYNKVTEATVGATAKNSKSFVFQRVEAAALIKNNNNKRKATEGTPSNVKKLRLADLSPAPGNTDAARSSRAKKLFGNW